MSRIDNKYIEALGNFTDALGEIVELLKEQQKKGTEDVVNNFAQTPMGDLSKVVDELKTIKLTTTKGFKDIKDQNNTILKKIESIKQQKESGMLDRIEDPKNKNKIVDGIKVVVLIAAGVLAMGMAFKLIGKVDFLSVIALSGSIFIMSKTFSQLMEFKNLKYIDVLKIASILPIMSFAILASAFLISKVPKISFSQGLSMIFVGGSLGVATWLLLKAIKDVEMKDFGKVFLLPFILPTISLALFLSSFFISKMPTIGFRQGLSLLFVGATLGISASMLLKSIKDIDLKKDFGKIFLLPFILPTISLALFLSAFIIQNFPLVGFKQGLSLLFVGATLGASAWILLKAIKGIDLKKDFGKIFLLPAILPTISLALYLSAVILQKFPNIGFKQGLSILFVGATLGVATWVLLKAIKNVNIEKEWKTIFALPFVLPTISLALYLSAVILQKFPNIGFKQGLSILFVGATLGVATWVLLKAIKNVNIEKEWKTIFALPFVLPTISLALYLSAVILQKFPNIGFKQGLSILFVGATLGVATWVLLKAIKNVNIEKEWKTIFALPFVLPLIAYALTLSSSILQDFEPLKKPMDFLISTALIGISVLIFSPVIKNIGKMDFKDILKGTVSIPLVALAIVVAAYVFRELPTDMKYPDFMWSLGVGLSILVFAPMLWLVGKFGLDKMIDGMIAIPLIALSIVLTSKIFNLLPNEMKYPAPKWTLGTGLSLLAFGGIAAAIGAFPIIAVGLLIGLPAILLISGTIVAVSHILGAGKYENYPSLKWSTSVGLSLLAFSVASVAALAAGASNLIGKLFTGGTDPLVDLAQRMVNVANKLNEVNWDSSNYPKKEYAEGVGGLLLAFAEVFAKISRVEGFNKIVTSLFGGGQSDNFTTFIDNAANAIILSYNKLNEVNWDSSNYPKKEYAEGVGGLLLAFAEVFAKISRVEGFNKIVTSLFGGGQSDNFTTFIDNAANAIILSYNKLNEVNWDSSNYPKKEYAEGVGGLLESLANVFSTISKIEGKNKFLSKFGGGGSTDFIGFVGTASDAMVLMRGKLAGDWTKVGYPTKDYAEGVGGFLESLANSFASISKVKRGKIQGFSEFVYEAANAMLIAKTELGKTIWLNLNYPKKEYSEGIGAFLLSMGEAYSKINSGGIFKFLSGNKQSLLDFVKEASNAIVESSKILAGGNFSNIIDKKYIEGFTDTMIGMSKITKSIKNLEINENFSIFSINAATTISKASKVLGEGNYTNIPDKKYTESFSKFVITYSDLAKSDYKIEDFEKFDKSIDVIINSVNKLNQMPDIKDSMANNMIKISESLSELGKGVDSFMHETPSGLAGKAIRAVIGKKKRDMTEFSNFSTALLTLVSALQILSSLQPMPTGIMSGYQSFLTEFSKLPDMTSLDPKIESINRLSNSFASLAASLIQVNNNLDGFTNLSKGLFLISVIDDTKFDNVLKSVDKYKTSLQLINNIPSEQANLLSTIKGLYETASNKPETTVDDNKVVVDDKSLDINKKQQFYDDVAYIRSILENIKDEMAKPSQQSSPWV